MKLCLLAQVKPLIDPSLYSLKRPTSSAPESSLCLVDPTRKTFGFSFFWSPPWGLSCSTSSSAPDGGETKIKTNKRRTKNINQRQMCQLNISHLHSAVCLLSCSVTMQQLPLWCLRPALAPLEEWNSCYCCLLTAASSSALPGHLQQEAEWHE